MTRHPPLRLGMLRLADSAAALVAAADGMFDALGLDVSILVEPSWANILDKLTWGLLDAAIVMPPLAIAAVLGLRGARARLLIPMGLTSGGNSVVVSRAAWRAAAAGASPAEQGALLLAWMRRQPAPPRFGVVHDYSSDRRRAARADRGGDGGRTAGRLLRGRAVGRRGGRVGRGTNTPAKVKMAVSGCPRNCAEFTIKDFGVIAVGSGWELHVAGNGGIRVRVTDFLCKVETAEDVLEFAAGFLRRPDRRDAACRDELRVVHSGAGVDHAGVAGGQRLGSSRGRSVRKQGLLF